MNPASATRTHASRSGESIQVDGSPFSDRTPPTILPAPWHLATPSWRRLGMLAAGLAATLLSACADVGGPIAGEPTNGCMLAAINERAVLRAKNYMQPNVEAHLLAIWFQDSRHVALVVKGDKRWFAWDDAYGGRPLFHMDAKRLPNPIAAAQAAFPQKNVELAWWAD